MDALKSAGRALIRSPSLAKQSLVGGRHRSECVRPASGLRGARGQSGPGGLVPTRAAGPRGSRPAASGAGRRGAGGTPGPQVRRGEDA